VIANGRLAPVSDPMLRAVGDVVSKELTKRDEVIVQLRKELCDRDETIRKEIDDSLRNRPLPVNHIDTAPFANSIVMLADTLRQAMSWQKAPIVNTTVEKTQVDVAAPSVNFDLGSLVKALTKVAELSLDQPLPAVNVPTEGLVDLLREILSAPRLPDVQVAVPAVNLSELEAGLLALAASNDRISETLDSVAALLSSLSTRLVRLEQVVTAERPKRRLRITEDGIEEI
jgi:hypothetical protein